MFSSLFVFSLQRSIRWYAAWRTMMAGRKINRISRIGFLMIRNMIYKQNWTHMCLAVENKARNFIYSHCSIFMAQRNAYYQAWSMMNSICVCRLMFTSMWVWVWWTLWGVGIFPYDTMDMAWVSFLRWHVINDKTITTVALFKQWSLTHSQFLFSCHDMIISEWVNGRTTILQNEQW